MKDQMIGDYSTTHIAVTHVTYYLNGRYDDVIQRFRLLVPKLDVSRVRAASMAEEISQAIEDARTPTGFVLFAEYNHAGWMRHFVHRVGSLRRAHRFTFGNPLFALPILQEEIEAALHIPLDCCFIEELDTRKTKLVFTLPSTMLGETIRNSTVKMLEDIEAKLFALIRNLEAET